MKLSRDTGRLWSLWELMNQFNAKWVCMRTVNFTNLEDHYSQLAGQPVPITSQQMDEVFIKQLGFAIAECERLGLGDVKTKLIRMRATVILGKMDASALSREACHARQSFVDALDRMKYVFIEPDLTPYVDQDALFGPIVAADFPTANRDIKEAGNCLAIGANTAAVFHLMRASELAMRAFCGHLGFVEVLQKRDPTGQGNHDYIPLEYATCEKILGQLKGKIEARLDTIPDKRQKHEAQEFYGPIAEELWALKEAWRNHVMHARKQYLREDAVAVMAHVKRLMTKLVERVQEV
jgi:hypothetical protein